MKKEFLDYLYEQKAKLQAEIDELIKMKKQDICQCCRDMDKTNP